MPCSYTVQYTCHRIFLLNYISVFELHLGLMTNMCLEDIRSFLYFNYFLFLWFFEGNVQMTNVYVLGMA